MNYKHLTTFEQTHIRILFKKKVAIRKIDNQIDQSSSTISIELKRNASSSHY